MAPEYCAVASMPGWLIAPKGVALPFEIEPGFTIAPFPPWMQTQEYLGQLTSTGGIIAGVARRAFIVTYTGEPASVLQEHARACARIERAKLAAWIAGPFALNSSSVLFAASEEGGWSPNGFRVYDAVRHRREEGKQNLTQGDLERLRAVYLALASLPPGSVRRTANALSVGITHEAGIRYVLVWLALEAIFGPADGRRVTKRLSARIPALLAIDLGQQAQAVSDDVRTAYDLRCDVVHGREIDEEHSKTPGRSEVNSEQWARLALCKVLGDPTLAATFSNEEKRDAYLDGLVLGR